MAKIEPKILKGFRDFLPSEQIVRQEMIQKIRTSFETFGFEPAETPALEYAEILTGKYGEEGDKLMYRFRDNGDRDVALRYDLTIPLARLSAMNGDLKKPWKRYQISPVWRAENTQKGRFREFYQCDADIVGSSSTLADAEILALSANTLFKLGLKKNDFVIRVNSREIIFAFYDSLGLSESEKLQAVRIVDKVDKIGREGVAEELKKSGFSEENIRIISQFAYPSTGDVLTPADFEWAAKQVPEVALAYKKVKEVLTYASELSPNTKFVIDLSIARGLDYYTGIIFEASLTRRGFGSIAGGGRYDNLIGMFSNKAISAVGTSIGLDRLIDAMKELGLLAPKKTIVKALVINFDESLTGEYLKITSDLREVGVNTIFYFEATDLKKQLSYASDRGIKYAIIYGLNEAKEGVIIIKDMEKGTQEKTKRQDLVKYFKK